MALGTSRFSRKLARASSSSSSSSYSSLVRFIGNLLFTSYNVSQNSPRKVTKFNSINKFLNLIRPKLPEPVCAGYAQHKTRFGTAKFVNYSILKVKTILSSWQLHSPNNPPYYSPIHNRLIWPFCFVIKFNKLSTSCSVRLRPFLGWVLWHFASNRYKIFKFNLKSIQTHTYICTLSARYKNKLQQLYSSLGPA